MELTKESIQALLATNDKAIGRALLVLVANQTADEVSQETVKHVNGKGFRPAHARMGTSMGRQFARTGSLSAKQVAYWRVRDRNGNSRIGIYWRQLIEAAQKKALAKDQVIE